MELRFLVFGGSTFYPYGGVDDFREGFSTHLEALEYCNKGFEEGRYDWLQVWDRTGSPLRFQTFHKSYLGPLSDELEALRKHAPSE